MARFMGLGLLFTYFWGFGTWVMTLWILGKRSINTIMRLWSPEPEAFRV